MTDRPVILMPDRPPALPRGRLIFALDATASREPTWETARNLQARMFREAAPIGHLDVQLVFFRGNQCRMSEWVSSGDDLTRLMGNIKCVSGPTQIGKVLAHVRRETEQVPVQALVFIGDAMEKNLKQLAPF
jgi:hypothetical protein